MINPETNQDYTLEDSLRALIHQISAYVEQFHGGTVEMVSFDGKILAVRLGGAWLDCRHHTPILSRNPGGRGQILNVINITGF
jgi:Fe-S cluster biogenesis protein NfuA